MNEQAFKDLYQEFVKTGYLGTEKDFKILMGTDSDAFNDGFSQFTTTGYSGDSDAFAELIGVSNPLKKKEDSTFVAPEQNLVLDTEDISSAIQPQTEQDYFEGTFGDILRGFDSVSPIGLGDFIDDMARSVAGGYNQGTVADVSSDILMRGADATEEDILKYIEANKDAQKFGPSDEMMEYLDTYKENGEGFMGVIMGLGKAGLTVIPEVLLSSITAMASSQKAVTSGLAVAGTAAAYGGAVGALAGGVGAGPGALAAGAASLPYAFAAAGATLEMGATFSELLQEEIEGELTPEKIREALNNEETYTSIRNKAIARGFTIGAIDAFTGRVGGKIAGKILSKGGKTITKAQKLKSIGAASAVEGVGGSAGEATARAVIGQDMDISEIALEGIAEVPGGIKDVISARYSKPKYKVNGKKVDASTIDDLIETMNLDQLQSTKIKIDNDYEGRDQKLQDKVLQLNTERLILEANPDINPETLAEITKLQLELSKLDGNKTEVAKEKAGVIKSKIKDLQENQLETEVETDADVFLELEQGQQIRYLDQAGKELVAEAEARGDEDFNISEEQSLARAVELFNKDQSTQGATKPKAAAKATTLNDLVNRPVTLTELGGSPLETPIEGDLYIEGQQVVIEDSDGNITEIGNVDEVLQKPLSEIGVKQDVSNISIDNDGNLNFNDKTLVPEKSGIKINKRGEISRVVLRSPDGGETVTLRGVNAEEAAYQILLKEAESMDTFPKSGQTSASPKKINEILEQDEEFQNELREAENTAETKTDQDTTEVIDEKQEVAPKLEAEQKVSKDRSLKEDVRSKVNKAANGDGKGKVGFAKKWFNSNIMEIAGLKTDEEIKEYYIQSLENNEPIGKNNKDFYAKEFKRLGIDANLYIKKDSKAKVESAPDVTKPAPEVAPKVETEEETNTYSKRVNTLIGLNSNFREDNGEVVMGGISVKVDDLLSMTSTEFNDFIEFTKKKFKIETVNDNQSTGVKREKLSNIDTDENRFQGRAALNEDVVNNIASNWSDSDQDPIQIWKDPKNNKTYVLSGHHRFAAAKLAGKSDIKIIDRTNDFNESQAIKFATEDANANRTMETPLERANTLRKKRKKGDSKKELNDFVKREGKNKVFVENLSFLNPKGVIFQTLSRFSNNTDKQTQNKLEKIADWIGDARKRNSKLTDSHEKELFDFLNNKEQSKRFTNKTDFLSKVNSLTSEMFFDETKPLNIAKFKNKTEGEKQYDKDVSNQKEAIQKLEDKEKNIRDRFNDPNNENYINPNDSAYDSIKKRANNVLKDVEAKLKFERAKLLDIYKNKGKYNRAGINQVGMFDEQADNARKALKKLDEDIKIVIHTDDASYRKASGEESREQSTRGEYNPATKTININATKAQANTIAHEVFHALLLRNGISNKQAKAITDKMFKAVKKTASPELLARLEKFSSNYESSLQSEESIAELFGILASEYKSLDKPTQNIIQKWINKLAKLMGVKSFTDAEIIDLLNVVSAKVEAGQEITGQDVKILDSKKPKKTSKESRKQVDRVALNKMGDRFYMKKNGYMPYKSTPLGELQRDARKLGFRIETRYITEGKRRGTPTGYFIYNKKSDEGYPIMLNPRNNKEKAIKPLYKSRKQKPNYKIAKINTPNTTINVVEGAGPDSFEIATKDYKATEGAEGSTIIGFVKNKDFPGEKKKETRGEIFILQVGDKGKGTGTSLMLDALRLMKENGTKTVKFTVPSKEGKPFNESLVRKGYINLLKVSDRTGTSEYEITDKVLEDAPQSRKQRGKKPSKKPTQKRTSSIKKAITEIKNVLKITPDEQRTIFKALNDQKKKAKEIKKDVVSSLKDLVKKGKITSSKMVSVINKVPDDFNNPTTVERFVEYMAKVFNDADYGNKMIIANSKKRRAKKNVSTKIGIADGLVQQLQRLFSVKPELIPSSVLEDYMSLINTFGQRATVLSLPDIKEVTQITESILEQIDEEQSMAIELADRYEASEKVYNKKTGDLDYAATIKQMLDNEVIDEREYEVMKKYKSVINPPAPATPKTEAEIEQERQDTIESIRETKEVDPSVLPSRLERDLAKKFQKLLKTDAIESLSLNDLKNLLKIIDNINNGYLPHYAQIMTGKMNAIENAKIGDQAIRRSKLLPISKIYARIKTKFTKKGAVQELIRRNPTFYIDQVFGDFKTKDIFDSIFRDSAEGSANYTKAIKEIQAKIEKAEQAVLKSFKRNPNKTLMSKYKQMSYLVQQEFLSNPDSNQVNSVEDFIKATLKRIKQETTSYTENDAKMLQEILDTYTDNGTKTFDNVALYESFNVAERNSIKTLEEINNSLTERAVYTANIIRGNKITPLKNYTHLSVIPEVGKNDIMETESSQVSDMFNKYLKPSTKAKSLIQRTGKASALNFDVYASVQRGSKYTLMDFHLTEPIRTSRRTLNQIEKNLSDKNGMMPGNARIKFNAIRDASIESIENLLSNALTQSSFADQVVNDIQKQGYRAILAGAPRAAYELISNLGAVVFIDPKGFSAGVKLRKIIGSPDGKNIMTNLDSTETNRVFSTGLSGKFVDTGILNQAAGITASKAKGRAVNTLLQLWNNTGQRWKKGVEFTADTLISSPDKLIMQPTWFGAFENRFKKITGKSPDFDKIAANDEVYMDKYASALKESTKLADSRSVLIGATDNAFMGILKGTVKPNQSVMLKAFNSFNGFMTRFLIFEYITARTGIMALVTKGTVSKKQGAALMAGVTTRMVLYTFLGTLVGETIKSLTEEEEEEDFNFSEAQYEDDSANGMKSVEKMLGQAFVSTFTSLLFGRDLGNATKSMVNLGLEEFNEQYLQILRDGKYDKFRDAIQYTIIPEGKSGRGPKFFDIAQNLFAAFTPMLKTGVLAVNTAFDSDRKEPDAIKRQQDVRFIRLPLEILGTLGFIPLYKDVRKIVLANMYKGLRKAQAESDSNKKIKEQMLQGYNSESDMKRYDLPLWEVTFGPDSPGYDRRQAQKELKRKERKLKKLMKDELYNYSPTTKSRGRKSSPFGSDDSGKSSSPFGSSKGSGKSSSPFGG